MTSKELKERLEKAQATVEKKVSTVEKHKQQAEKKLQIVKANGWEQGIGNIGLYRGNYEAMDALFSYRNKLRDIEDATDKLEEAKAIVKNWLTKYHNAIERERKLATEVPEAFKEAKEELVKSWVKNDITQRDYMIKKKAELTYKEFRKLYKYTIEESLTHTDEEFKKMEEREAESWLLDLYNRVVAITGEITDASHIRWGGKCLDGFIVGKEGKANVTTIGAGGYNIQRWHLRTLVQETK